MSADNAYFMGGREIYRSGMSTKTKRIKQQLNSSSEEPVDLYLKLAERITDLAYYNAEIRG